MAAMPSYRAEMIGLSERDRTLLRSLLMASQARTGVRWDGEAGQPAVHFVDIEGQAGADFWHSLGDGTQREATIVLSSKQPADVVHWLAKPVRSASLLGVLEKMLLSARSAAAGTATPARARPLPPADSLHLLDILDGAGGNGARAVQSLHWPDLILNSDNTHAMRTAPLENYVDGFVASIEASRVVKYTGGPLADDLHIDVDTLRWLALLYAPINEIAAHLPYPSRARLTKLPAFGQLPHKKTHLRMAAWLVQHAATPQELAELIDTDEEIVQRFLGACAAQDLLQVVLPEAKAEPKPEPAAIAAAIRARRPIATAAVADVPIVAETPPASETPLIAETPLVAEIPVVDAPVDETPAAETSAGEVPPSEAATVLERLRVAREQNRARVAAAIRSVSGR